MSSASSALARPGDLTLRFTKTWPIQEAVFCGESDNFARVFSGPRPDYLLWQTDRMETFDCAFGGWACDPANNPMLPFRPIINESEMIAVLERQATVGKSYRDV